MANYCKQCLEENYSQEEIDNMIEYDNDSIIIKDGIKPVVNKNFTSDGTNLFYMDVCENDNSHNGEYEEGDYLLEDEVLTIG